MTQNPTDPANNPDSTRNAVLATLAREVGELSQRIATLMAVKPALVAAPKPAAPEWHPIETAILEALAASGKAIRKTALADSIGVERSSVHYHCNRLITKRKIREITDEGKKHRIDWVILKTQCPKIPGIDD